MKKSFILLAMAMTVISCGTAKKVADNNQASQTQTPQTQAPQSQDNGLGELMAKSREQVYAEDPDADNMRAWALYNGFENQNLESFSATIARANLAGEIATLVQTAVDIYDSGARIDNKGVKSAAENVKTAEMKGDNKITAVSQELIKGSRVVMSDRYRQKDGTVNCYTAVEISLKSVLNNIKNNQTIRESISQDRRQQIDYDSKQFEESMQAAYEALKEAKGQN